MRKIITIILILATSSFTYAQQSYCEKFPWMCVNGIPIGGPGSPPIQLNEVPITAKANPYWPFGFPSAPPLPGWSITGPGTPSATTPCPGDPLVAPALTPSRPGNYKGGTFGFTRTDKNGNPKLHDGIDITATPGSNVYSMYDGEVTATVDTFLPGEYKEKSYGNYVEIRSTVDGKMVYFKYNHLDGVNVAVGSQVTQGQQIGKSGTTGNAASSGVIPHVHIQGKDADRQKIDPEPYVKTKFDKTTGLGTNPCN